MSTLDGPTILILALGDEYERDYFARVYAKLLEQLFKKANIIRGNTLHEALTALNDGSTPLRGVLVVTPDTVRASLKHRELSDKLVEYVQTGGIIVYGGSIAGWGHLDDLNVFRNTWLFQWEYSDYYWATFTLNKPAMGLEGSSAGLEPSYASKCVCLKNVNCDDYWYIAAGPNRKSQVDDTPVAFRKVEEGWVGYTGDANAADGTTKAILRMFRL